MCVHYIPAAIVIGTGALGAECESRLNAYLSGRRLIKSSPSRSWSQSSTPSVSQKSLGQGRGGGLGGVLRATPGIRSHTAPRAHSRNSQWKHSHKLTTNSINWRQRQRAAAAGSSPPWTCPGSARRSAASREPGAEHCIAPGYAAACLGGIPCASLLLLLHGKPTRTMAHKIFHN